MRDFPTLKNAPIVEAVFEVKTLLPPGDHTIELQELHAQFSHLYPKQQLQRTVQIGFKISQKEPQSSTSSSNQKVHGYRFLSQDGKKIIQCRRDGFSFNQLAPYSTWENFSGSAVAGWKIFAEKFPTAVKKRIGLRYINRVSIPFQGPVRLEEFLKMCPPEIPIKGIYYTGFLNHSALFDSELMLKCNWIMTGQPVKQDTLPLVLDIDVYDDSPRILEKSCEEIMESMRLLKNRLFFETFTAKGLDLFNVSTSSSCGLDGPVAP
jgi:uncharacterized protein (TIGR04255 family)